MTEGAARPLWVGRRPSFDKFARGRAGVFTSQITEIQSVTALSGNIAKVVRTAERSGHEALAMPQATRDVDERFSGPRGKMRSFLTSVRGE